LKTLEHKNEVIESTFNNKENVRRPYDLSSSPLEEYLRKKKTSPGIRIERTPSPPQVNVEMEQAEEDMIHSAQLASLSGPETAFKPNPRDSKTGRISTKVAKETPRNQATRSLTLGNKLGFVLIYDAPNNADGSSDPSDSGSSDDDVDAYKKKTAPSVPTRSTLPQAPKKSDANIHLAAVHQGVLTTARLESYSHISLESLYVDSFFKFQDDITAYKARTGIMLRASTLVSNKVITQILTHSAVPITTKAEFYALTDDTLIKYIQRRLRPETANAFSKSLQRACSMNSPEGYEVTSRNFEYFLSDLVAYSQDFQRTFLFLAHHNAANIPKVDDKDGGLIHIYLAGIPKSFAKAVLFEIRTDRAPSIRAFIDDIFLPYVFTLQKFFKSSRRLDPFLSHFGQSSKSSDSSAQARKPEAKANSAIVRPNRPAPRTPFPHKLHALEEESVAHAAENLEESSCSPNTQVYGDYSQDQAQDSQDEQVDTPLNSHQGDDLELGTNRDNTLNAMSLE
jgi:hypothetical protein